MSANTITDANTLYEMARLYVQTFPGYNREIIRVLKITRVPNYSDRSDTLGGENPQQIVKQALDALVAHRANKNNPHQETVRSIGILNSSETEALLTNKLPAGLIAVSAFGYDYLSWADVSLTGAITRSGKDITIKPNLQVLMTGGTDLVQTDKIDLSSISSTWSSSVWYLYVRMVEGRLIVEADTRKFADTITRMYIGSTGVNTNTVNLLRVIRTGKYRLSVTPVGTGIAIGRGSFVNGTGIDPRWVPSVNITQPALPPKVAIDLEGFDRGNGANGYIEMSRDGLLMLQVNVNVAPNIYFKIDGDSVVTSASIQVISGATPTVTRVNNLQYRVSCASYSLARITVTATIPGGDTATYTFFTEHRTNLTIGLASHNFIAGTQGGTTKLTAMANNVKQLVLGLTGDGVTTNYSVAAVSGGGQSVTKNSLTTYSISGPGDSLKLYTFIASDRYGRTATTVIYVETRLAFPPVAAGISVYKGRFHRGHMDGPGSTASAQYWTGPGRYYAWGEVGAGLYDTSGRSGDTVIAISTLPGHRVQFISWRNISKVTGLSINYYSSDYLPGQLRSFSGAPSGLATLFPLVAPVRSVRRGYGGNIYGIADAIFRISNEISETIDVYIRLSVLVEVPESMSCFTPDSKVTMSDNTLKKIVDVKIGDTVLTPTGPQHVWRIDTPKLGNGRKLMSFNGKCKTSNEHSFWAKDPTSEREFWATRNLSEWQKEAECDKGPNFDGILPIDLTDVETEYEVATIDGWDTVKTTVEEELSVADLQLYNLRLEGGGSYFVDGYLVSSMCTIDCDVDWEQFKWDGKIQLDYPIREIPWSQSVSSENSLRHHKDIRTKRRNRNK